MSKVGDAYDRARSKIDDKADRILTDLCDIVSLGLVSDGHSGKTEGETPYATNIPVEVSEAAPGVTVNPGSGASYTATHRLKFSWNPTTAGINPKQKITVQARGNESEMVFEQPVRERGSKSIYLFVLAKLTTGFRSPANV